MKRAGPGLSTALLLVATTLWGASSAVLAELGRADGTGAPLLAAGGAATLMFVASAGRARRDVTGARPARHVPKWLLLIGLIEALNLGLYAAALALGPVPVVVALHLTSPVLLVALSVARGSRPADGLVALQTLLLVAGTALLGMQPADRAGSAPILACAFAVGSAAAVAALIAAVTRLAPTVNPDVAAAVQLTIAAVVTAPVILVRSPPDRIDTIVLLAAGALFLGPGFAVYWRALRGLDAATASILGLNEALSAAILGWAVFGDNFSVMSALSGALVLTAITMEPLRNRFRVREVSMRRRNNLE